MGCDGSEIPHSIFLDSYSMRLAVRPFWASVGFWLLTANLAVLTAFGKLHDVSRDHPLVASLIGSSPWLAVICKCQIKSEDVKKPKKKFALATRIEDVEI